MRTQERSKWITEGVLWGIILSLLMLWLFSPVEASTRRGQEIEQEQRQYQRSKQVNEQTTEVETAATATAAATTTSFSDASGGAGGEGGSVSVSSSGGNDTVYVPNNNTESCLRVFGIAVPTKDGAAILGIPWRSGPCGLEAAADDAFAQGQLALGWTLKCKQKALKKAFGGEGACLSTAMEGVNMASELTRLREQNETLLRERVFEQEECDNRVDRANQRTSRCEEKFQQDK